MTVGRITTSAPNDDHLLEITRRASGICVVDELVLDVGNG
jgi:hypothetical protein